MLAVETNHIVIDDHGAALVAGTPFSVEQISREMLANSWTPAQFCRQHRHEITLAQIHAALSYHYDHLDNTLMRKERILNAIGQHKEQLRKFGVKRLGIFGSCVRNEADQASDIDVLVDLKEVSLSKYMDVKRFLETLFGRKVDLVLNGSLKPKLRNQVLKDLVYAEGL